MTISGDRSALPDKNATIERNRREVIRFPSEEECQKAFQALIDLGEQHQITMHDDPKEWWVNTNLVRKLRALGVQFRWLTETI